MTQINITINCDNEAFTEYPESEVARILKQLATSLDNGHNVYYLYDINGNKCGTVETIE